MPVFPGSDFPDSLACDSECLDPPDQPSWPCVPESEVELPDQPFGNAIVAKLGGVDTERLLFYDNQGNRTYKFEPDAPLGPNLRLFDVDAAGTYVVLSYNNAGEYFHVFAFPNLTKVTTAGVSWSVAPTALALNPTGTILAAAFNNGKDLEFWDTTQTPWVLINNVPGLSFYASENQLKWNPSGTMLAMAHGLITDTPQPWGGSIRYLTIFNADGTYLNRTWQGIDSSVSHSQSGIAWYDNENIIIKRNTYVGGFDGMIAYEASTGSIVKTFANVNYTSTDAIDVEINGNDVIIGGQDSLGPLRSWDWISTVEKPLPVIPSVSGVNGLAINPTTNQLWISQTAGNNLLAVDISDSNSGNWTEAFTVNPVPDSDCYNVVFRDVVLPSTQAM